MTRRENHFNVVVIGAGPGGLVAAAGLAGLGARVALLEKQTALGGDCLHTGCVPSKALIASARVAHAMRTGDRFGLPGLRPEIDLASVFSRMREMRARVAEHDAVERFEEMGVRVATGAPAAFTSPHTVEAGAVSYTADRFVIAAGSRPARPPIPGLDRVGAFTSETFFDEMNVEARSACVLGGGPIGLEMAQTLARLGVATTVVETEDRVLGVEDPDAAAVVRGSLEADGVVLMTGHAVERVAPVDGAPDGRRVSVFIKDRSTGRTLEGTFDMLLVATGRRPLVEGLGLRKAGIEHTSRGIDVDRFLRTSRRHIFAVGDVVGSYQFTHFADAQARAVVRNILIPWWPAAFDDRVVPWCTYTDPECARVGHNEASAADAGVQARVLRFDLADLDRPVVDGRPEGFVKVLADRKGRVLGATIVGPGAGDWIHEYVLAMKHDVRLPALAATVHAYPTYGEASRRPADRFMRDKLTPRVKRLLGWRWGRR